MNTAKIISALDEELARLREVRDLLAGSSSAPTARRGRPKAGTKLATRGASATGAAKPARKKRVLSEEARQRIADAQKRRWAAQKGGSE